MMAKIGGNYAVRLNKHKQLRNYLVSFFVYSYKRRMKLILTGMHWRSDNIQVNERTINGRRATGSKNDLIEIAVMDGILWPLTILRNSLDNIF